MREMEWPPARGGAGLLIDRQRLTARRLGGLGQTLISGDLDAAIAELAPGAPMLGLYALRAGERACFAHRADERAARHARASFRRGRLARRLVRDQRRRWLGPRSRSRARTRRKRSCRRPRPTSPRARPRPPFLSSACAACSRGRLPASACTSSRRGWRRCSPGSTGCEAESPRWLVIPDGCCSGRSGIRSTKGGLPLRRWIFPLARE